MVIELIDLRQRTSLRARRLILPFSAYHQASAVFHLTRSWEEWRGAEFSYPALPHQLATERKLYDGSVVPASTSAADISGSADVAFSSGLPNQARFAVAYANRWSFGQWLGDAELQSGEVSLQVARDIGGLFVVSDRQAAALSIATSDGWNVSTLLTILGRRPSIGPDRPVRLDGLPAGSYAVVLNGQTLLANVNAASVAEVRFR